MKQIDELEHHGADESAWRLGNMGVNIASLLRSNSDGRVYTMGAVATVRGVPD